MRLRWTLNRELTAAPLGWFAVSYPATDAEPEAAEFCPIVAWGTINVLYEYNEPPETEPAAIAMEDGCALCVVRTDSPFFLGFSSPGEAREEWNLAAIAAWRAWQTRLEEKKTP